LTAALSAADNTAVNWKLPNQLTVGRIALAAVFFVLLGLYDQDNPSEAYLLDIAFVIYLVAGITDVLDGYLARKMNVVSAFGRIADPFVDKVLVVGAFAMLSGANFMQADSTVSELERNLPEWMTGRVASAVQAWMVVAIMAREFIVSAVRGYSESCGVKFPATSAGKIKMFVQSVAICAVLLQLGNLRGFEWAIILKIAMVWLAVLTTILSGLAYMGKARKLLVSDEPRP
jgi:phosphatidylglycerophosphate synthase